MTTAIMSAAGLQSAFTALDAIHQVVTSTHLANSVVAHEVVPPGNDPSSVAGDMSQHMRITDFATEFEKGLLSIQDYILELQAAVSEFQMVDAMGAASIALASPTGV